MTAPADPQPILDLIEAFRRSKAMFTAVRFGVFDQLEREPQTAQQLAGKLELNPGALARLLDACIALRLLSRTGQSYHNTALASKYLLRSSPATLTAYILYSDQSLYSLWAHLDDAVREGTNRWAQTFGSREALFAYFFRDEASTASFLAGMHGFGEISSRPVVRAFDLGQFTHLVDLGAATGHLAIAACELYPNLRATVFDLPQVQPFAEAHIRQSQVADRVTFIAGDFFANDLPSGDLYAIGRILHDWSDAHIAALLRKIFESLPSQGALLIAEALVNDDRSGPVYALMQDLNMLVCTEGMERTAAEYRALLEAAGFESVDYRLTGSPLDAVLARKAGIISSALGPV